MFALTRDKRDAAPAVLTKNYPYDPEVVCQRQFRPLDYTRAFIRDGFINP